VSVYLDHAATTPMSAAALAAYVDEASRVGNAASLHAPGRRALATVEAARESIAAALGARPSEVIFTSGGTESNNLAVKGIFSARRRAASERERVLVSAVEHPSVLEAARWLAADAGAETVLLPVDAQGALDVEALEAALSVGSVALASIMWANNEVGTIQPIHEAARLCERYGVPLHTDAVGAIGQVPVVFADSGVAAMSVSGHKLGGPAGVGVLVARRGLGIDAQLHGGHSERGMRPGTLDVPAIRALAVAVDEAVAGLDARAARLAALIERLISGVLAAVPDAVPDAVLRGAAARPDRPAAETGQTRLPGNALFTFPGCDSEALLLLLDDAGIAASTGAACLAGVHEPSHVLLAMGVPEAEARGAVRFSLGHLTTQSDVDSLVSALPAVVQRARTAGAGR
jgi:cysteine desulfurase